MNIALGTAQFIKNYGLLKKKFYPKNIFDFVNICEKIKMIDTAPSYGEAEKMIGKYLKKNIKITTKINPFLYSSVDKNLDKFRKEFDKSLANLKVDKIHGLLFHKEIDIQKSKHDKFFYHLEYLTKANIVSKIGFSTYNTDKVKKNLNHFNFKIIQLPINIFNFNQDYKKFLKNIKKKNNLEIHARSIFLQGLGFEEKINDKRFLKLNKKLDILKNLSLKNKISKFKLMINGIYDPKLINFFIIGKNFLKEIEEIKNLDFVFKKKLNFSFKKFIINDNFILNPKKWPKKI